MTNVSKRNGASAAVCATAIACMAAFTSLAAAETAAQARNAPHKTLVPFRSDQEFRDFVKRARPLQKKRAYESDGAPPPSPPPAMAAPADAAASSASESITNTQEAGVDEGGIVKTYGDMLVILRRGRLFTVSTAQGSLETISSINAFPPGVSPQGDWYDEMLIAGNRVIVIGYSYSRGGTEINRFRIDGRGRLSFEDAYHLRSNDYYSSRNYASRLIGQRLIVYSPLYLPYAISNSFDWMPAVRRWQGNNDRSAFQPIVSGRQIYMPPHWDDPTRADISALHTVTDCDLAAPVLRCKAISVLGPRSRNFYVSSQAVYVWVTGLQRDGDGAPAGLVYRLPLDGSAPSAVGVHGAPVDQFSFREDWNEGRLNVLVRGESGGDAMWRPEFTRGAVKLLQLPLNRFGDGSEDASSGFYRSLPSPGADSYHFQNRFVGNYVLYGTGNSWGRPQDQRSTVVAAAVRGSAVTQLSLSHGIDRIEAMGNDAVVIGADSRDLHFQAVELTNGWRPQLGDRYSLTGASQGETRSHAFFFKPDPRREDETAGLLGLPVARAGRPGHRQLAENSAAIIFLSRSQRQFQPLGELGANEDGVVDDHCQASCADWYGNARPIFLRGRVFALMGYELVEGALERGAISEVRRVNFAPSGR